MNSKNIIITFATASFVFSSVSPLYAQGIKRYGEKPALQDRATPSFCENLSERETKILARVNEREQNRMKLKQERLNKLGSERSTKNNLLKTEREAWDTKRTERSTELEALGTTSEKKLAIEEFQKTIEEAVETRKEAIDAAIKAFREGVDKSVSDRDVAVNKAIEKYKTAVKAAFTTAESSCSKETNALTVRTTLMASLKTANETLKKDISAIDKARENIQVLNEARVDAVQKAVADFKSTIEAAKLKLREVIKPLGEQSETEEEENTETGE